MFKVVDLHLILSIAFFFFFFFFFIFFAKKKKKKKKKKKQPEIHAKKNCELDRNVP